jgi:glycosyltransferase involved in cell wall biosynthesis
MKLTIAIPTYNRANRLEKALVDLCAEISLSVNRSEVEIYVSDNGSTDKTAEIIMQCSKFFEDKGIPFSSNTAKKNEGFDANVFACYSRSNSDYVWFLSDDDNISHGSIDIILRDINQYLPSVLFYNHDQKPYDRAHPYINKFEYFDKVTDQNIIAIQKIIRWPKLSALVIKKCESGLEVLNQDSGFMHIILALQCGLAEGGILHSPAFIAAPDNDYMDNINFVPYIRNYLDVPLRWVLRKNKKMSLYKELALPYVDPLISSLNVLGAYYRGRFVLTPTLKQKLWEKVGSEIGSGWIRRLVDWKLFRELVKLLISVTYGAGSYYLLGKKLSNIRRIPCDD